MKKKAFKELLTSIDQARKLAIAPLNATAISQCPKCLCMTYTIKGKCGKCKEKKSGKSIST